MFSCHFSDRITVLTAFMDSIPSYSTGLMEMKEVEERFIKKFPQDDDDNHYFEEKDLMAFLKEIGDTIVDRMLGKMVYDGILDVSHNGTEFCFSLKK